jgi:hypothetical protein
MKNLMLTTAMASVLTTAALAQTSITGQLRISYSDISGDKGVSETNSTTTTKDTSYGFGSEQQINISNKGKLPALGLDYAAGFAIENDGIQTTTLFNENVYIDLINASSGTTISFSQDHIQRSDTDFSATNIVGFTPNELSQLNNTTNAGTRFKQNIGAAPGQHFGAALLQKTPFGTFSYNFAPNISSAATATTASVAGSETVNPNTTAAYEYGFLGDLGVKGLAIHFFHNKANDFVTATNQVKAEAKNMGAKYNFGQVTVGVNRKVHQAETTNTLKSSTTVGGAVTQQSTAEHTEKAIAAAYAIDKNFTIGLLMAKAEQDGINEDQKIKAINIGYNLGPIALDVGYGKNKSGVGLPGNDSDHFKARMITNF